MPDLQHIRLAFIVALLILGSDLAAATEVIPVVSARTPSMTLSKNQMVDIFLGKSSHFPDGSLAMPIDLIEGSALRDEFYLKFAGKSPAQMNAHWSKIIFTGRGQPPREASSSADVKKLLLEKPGSIGYIDTGLVDASVRVLVF